MIVTDGTVHSSVGRTIDIEFKRCQSTSSVDTVLGENLFLVDDSKSYRLVLDVEISAPLHTNIFLIPPLQFHSYCFQYLNP